MSSKKRVGIFGGTFAPPHIGHVKAAEAMIKFADLDELIVIPTLLPPHKQIKGDASAEQRLEMTRFAFKDVEKARVSDMEICRGGNSYTVITLRELSSDDRELILYCGTDMLLTLDSWYLPREIFSLATIAYAARTTELNIQDKTRQKALEYISKYNAKVIEIPCEVIEISSAEIRDMISRGKNTGDYLTQEVEDYIKKWNLFKQ